MSEALARPRVETKTQDFDNASQSHAPGIKTDTPVKGREVHAKVAKIYLALHAVLFAVLFTTFSVDSEALFMVAISAFYLIMYIGTPYVLLSRIGGKRFASRSSWSEFLDAPHETFTGKITGRDALIQICLVPAAVTIGLTAICVILIRLRGA